MIPHIDCLYFFWYKYINPYQIIISSVYYKKEFVNIFLLDLWLDGYIKLTFLISLVCFACFMIGHCSLAKL